MALLEFLEKSALVVLGAMIIMSVWTWASDYTAETKEKAEASKDASILCSKLDVEFVDTQTNRTHTTVFISSNIDLKELEVVFSSENSREPRTVSNLKANSLDAVSAPVSEADISAYVPRCRN